MIDPLDSRQIAQAITYLAQNPDKRAQMGMNGYKAYKDKYNWAAEERKLLDVYERILNR
jgi:glycosyltransferase involved in cell wall biosynthesis